MFIQNGICLPDYTVSQPRTLESIYKISIQKVVGAHDSVAG
jgi:hypothetical protein